MNDGKNEVMSITEFVNDISPVRRRIETIYMKRGQNPLVLTLANININLNSF